MELIGTKLDLNIVYRLDSQILFTEPKAGLGFSTNLEYLAGLPNLDGNKVMKAIFSAVVTCFLFSNAQAVEHGLSAKQALLEVYNISVATEICTEEGYEIASTYPCFGDIQVENFSQMILVKVRALQLKHSESTIEFRLSSAWLFCINSHEVMKVYSDDGSISFKVQNCNLGKTLQTLLSPANIEITTNSLLPN